MREAIVVIMLLTLTVVCWALVIGHQLGWETLQDPDRYAPLKATMLIAYIWGGIAVAGVVALAAVLFLSKPR